MSLENGVNRNTLQISSPPQATTNVVFPVEIMRESSSCLKTQRRHLPPWKWRSSSSSHNTVKHSMDTHTHKTWLDLSVWVKFCVLCRIPIGSQSENVTTITVVGPLPTQIQTLFLAPFLKRRVKYYIYHLSNLS